MWNKNLIDYVKSTKVPKKGSKEDDMHILYPITNIKESKGNMPFNESKNHKKKLNDNNKPHKTRKSTSVIKTKEENNIDNTNKINKKNKHRQKSTKDEKDEKKFKNSFFDPIYNENNQNNDYNYFFNEIKGEKEKAKKEEKKKKEKKMKKEKTNEKIDLYLKHMMEENAKLKTKLKKREEIMEKYKKKAENQDSTIKDLEFIYNEMKTKESNFNIKDYDLNNNILYDNNYNFNDSFHDDYNFDIINDEDLQEELAIKAVEQQILDEICPNPDAMSYEQLLALEDNVGSVNKGLTDEQIQKLPLTKFKKKKFAENFQCIICMEEFQEKETVKLLPCGHIFHDNCIKQWLLKQKTCPFCKSEIR